MTPAKVFLIQIDLFGDQNSFQIVAADQRAHEQTEYLKQKHFCYQRTGLFLWGYLDQFEYLLISLGVNCIAFYTNNKRDPREWATLPDTSAQILMFGCKAIVQNRT